MPVGGVIGLCVGATEGAPTGQVLGAHGAATSYGLSQMGCTCPSTQEQMHLACDIVQNSDMARMIEVTQTPVVCMMTTPCKHIRIFVCCYVLLNEFL